jgi:antitoxin VapB
MALNIKDPETDRLARELAAETGESITVAARRAIEERLQRVRARASVRPEQTELDELLARSRARATHDDRTAEEILGYDVAGLPG